MNIEGLRSALEIRIEGKEVLIVMEEGSHKHVCILSLNQAEVVANTMHKAVRKIVMNEAAQRGDFQVQ